MRIALLHPTYWPEVRRGSERLIHDLGVTLAERGHDVTLLTTHPGPGSEQLEDGIRVIRSRRAPALPGRLRAEYFAADEGPLIARLLRGRFDLAHAFVPPYGSAAVRARSLGGPPVVHSFHGLPSARSLTLRRGRRRMMRVIVRGAAAVSVLSEAAADALERELGTRPLILPGGVRCADFPPDGDRSQAPTLVCAASLGDGRKRGRLLLAAFAALRERRPGVRLRLAGGRDPILGGARLAVPDGAEIVDADDIDRLAGLYASAWASVLPAVDEAFGLVLIESLAAGTPVVAARSGACPEIVDRDTIGRLFEADDQRDLVEAMDAALELAGQPGTQAQCRRRAEDWDWPRVVERYEAVYAEAVA